MSNKNNGICCGGDYTKPAKSVNPNAHQGSPSKRHNAATIVKHEQDITKLVEHIELANYVAIYIQKHTADVRSLSDLIYAGIGRFYND